MKNVLQTCFGSGTPMMIAILLNNPSSIESVFPLFKFRIEGNKVRTTKNNKRMPFESAFNGQEVVNEKTGNPRTLLGCGLYAIKQHPKAGSNCGPAPKLDDMITDEATGEQVPGYDIVDEAVYYFKSNMMHKTFEVKGPGDRTILYLTLYIQQCLKRLLAEGKKATKTQARQTLLALAIERSKTPIDSSYPFNAFHPEAKKCNEDEIEQWREYAKQLRLECGVRLIQRIFVHPEEDGTANKWWLTFGNQKFLGSQLER